MNETARLVIDREIRRCEQELKSAFEVVAKARKAYGDADSRAVGLVMRIADLKAYLAEQGYTRPNEIEAFLEDNAEKGQP